MIRLSARPRQSDWLNPVEWERARLARPTLLPMHTHPSRRELAWARVSSLFVSGLLSAALIGWLVS